MSTVQRFDLYRLMGQGHGTDPIIKCERCGARLHVEDDPFDYPTLADFVALVTEHDRGHDQDMAR